METKLDGKVVGVFQDELGFFARFISKQFPLQEVYIPITAEKFHSLKFEPATLAISTKP